VLKILLKQPAKSFLDQVNGTTAWSPEKDGQYIKPTQYKNVRQNKEINV